MNLSKRVSEHVQGDRRRNAEQEKSLTTGEWDSERVSVHVVAKTYCDS